MAQHFLDLGPLDFIFTEFNHDFHESGAGKEMTQIGPETYLALFNNYDADSCIYDPTTQSEQTYIHPHLTNAIRMNTNYCANNKWYNDEGIVKAVFCGRTKSALCALAQSNLQLMDISVCVKEKYDHTEATLIYIQNGKLPPPLPPGVHAANFRHYITTRTPAKYQYYTAAEIQNSSNLIYKKIFGNLQDIYIVSDAAGSFVRDICDDENFANVHYPRRVHCMYSTSTFGDPSNLQHPNDKFNIYRPRDENCKKYSWICATPLTKGPTDAGTLIHAAIQHSWPNAPWPAQPTDSTLQIAAQESVRVQNNYLHYTPASAFQVKKHIAPVTPAPNTLQTPKIYPNAKEETTIAAVIKYFSEPPKDNNKIKKSLRKLWRAQGKRLGDHEQVLFAKLLQDHVLCHQKAWKLVEGLQGGYNGDGVIQNNGDDLVQHPRTSQKTPLPDSNSDNTFFTTGDWPCFCYAIYNKINCILLVHQNWHVVKFN